MARNQRVGGCSMDDDKEKKNFGEGIDRRKFLKYMGATGAAMALSEIASSKARAVEIKRLDMAGEVHILGWNEKNFSPRYLGKSNKTVFTLKKGGKRSF